MSIAVPLYGFGASGGSPNKSTIIVTAPTGSTVTCKMGSTTKTATEKNGVWTFGGLDLGTWTITSTKGGDSATQDVVITRLTVEYVTIVYRITPEFTYTGDYEIVDDSDNPISDFASWKNNWKIRFLTSGTLTFTKLNGWNGQLDVFLVGGGGGGSLRAGGGGGYTKTSKNIRVSVGTRYAITIGAGGTGANAGGSSSAFSITAEGGTGGYKNGRDGYPGNGGSGGANGADDSAIGAAGGSDGSNGGSTSRGSGGTGQGTTTREFGNSSGKLYAGGGGGGAYTGVGGAGGAGGGGAGCQDADDITPPANGQANTGGGGGGGSDFIEANKYSNGGSGIAIVRNAREAA